MGSSITRRLVLVATIFLLAPATAFTAPAKSGSRAAERFKNADRDGNGVLSRAEVERAEPGLAKHFDAIDLNRDGGLSPYEIRSWRKARRSERKAGDRGRFDAHFRQADLDSDGMLSRDEAQRGLPRIARKFEALDTNRDGKVSLAEMHAWLDSRRDARRKPSR